jgi:hypothetical protein
MTMLKLALLSLAGGLLLSLAGCMQPDRPLTPYQQEYYKKQQAYQELGDNRRNNDRPCPPATCK